MNKSDLLIMNVPFAALKNVGKEMEIENSRLTSLEETAKAIVEKSDVVAEQLIDDYQFAGNTSLNLNIMISGIPSQWQDKTYFTTHLTEKVSANVFTSGLRPELDESPKLIRAYEQHDRVILAFSYLGKARRYLENYNIVTRSPQIVEYVVIHFSPFQIEVRAPQDRNKIYRDEVLDLMGIENEVIWDLATKLDESQVKSLAVNLNAKLRAAKHRMTEGVYATKEVTAKTVVEDLGSTTEYQEEFEDQPLKKATLVFEYNYSFGHTETVSYVITDSGLWIRSRSGEEVFSHIINQIIKVKYPEEETLEEIFEDDILTER